jgi:hypothetical protein
MSLSRTSETFTPCSRQYVCRATKLAVSSDNVLLVFVAFLTGLAVSISSAIRFSASSVVIIGGQVVNYSLRNCLT